MTPLIRQLSNVNSRYFLSSEGMNIEYRRKGDPDRDTIVLVHGMGMDCRTFLANIDQLSEKYQIIAVSLRGHGLSDKPKPLVSESFTIEKILTDIVELTWSLGIQSFHWVGQAMGGVLGYELLKKDEMSLLSLTTISAPANKDGVRSLLKFAKKYTGITSRLKNRKKLAEDAARFVSHKEQSISYLKDEIFYGTNWDIVNLMKDHLADLDYSEIVSGSYVPIMIIGGEHDFATQVKGGKKNFQRTVQLISQNEVSRSHIMPDAGHLPQIDHPAVFNQILLDFISEI